MSWIETVNDFWFGEIDPKDWFSGAPQIDALIRARFGPLLSELKRKPPDPDSLSVQGLVAAVIVFDQFSRNIFRESAVAYATDECALAFARHAIDRAMDAQLTADQRHFLYLPFMHSEDRVMQTRSLDLFRQLGTAELLPYALHHKEMVDRFGRFPHRNRILGRPSTPEEREFLQSAAADIASPAT